MTPLLAAGRLDRRVTIVRPAVTRDALNTPVEGEPTRTVRWASVRPAPGTERFANLENAATAPTRFVLRWQADLVRITDRIEHDGRTYDVVSVMEIGRREGWEVLGVSRTEASA